MKERPHLTGEQIARYRSRALAPAELLELDDHLAACAECRDQVAPAAHVRDQLQALRHTLEEHLQYEQLVAYAEGRGDASANEHLEHCEPCRAELADLADFRGELAQNRRAPIAMPAPRRRWIPVAAAAAILVVSGIVLWNRSGSVPVNAPAASSPTAEAPLSQEQKQALGLATTTRRLELPPDFNRLVTRPGILLGSPEARSFDVVDPVATAVLTDHPTLRWNVAPGATQYVVSVFDEGFHKVAESPSVTALEWQSDSPLPRGVVLNWQVTAKVGEKSVNAPAPPAPEARFQVVPADVAAAIETTRRDHPGNHLLAAVLCARAGAVEDARRELEQVPDQSLAGALRDSLKR